MEKELMALNCIDELVGREHGMLHFRYDGSLSI